MDDTFKNIWVLGGTGFIGSALIDRLAINSDHRIHLLVNKRIASPQMEKYNCIQSDLGEVDFSWFEKFPPDIVFHMARMAGSNKILRRLAASKGLKANQRLVEFFINTERRPKIVYVSGSLVYGNQPPGSFALESADISPLAYAKDYYRAERPWVEAQKTLPGWVQLARPGWILGPGSWFKTFFWDHFVNTGTVPLYGSGNQQMSLIHLEDLARALVKIPESGKKVYNLFAAEPISQGDFSSLMSGLLGTKIQHIPAYEVKRRWGQAAAQALDSSIPLRTMNQEFLNQVDFDLPTPELMLRSTLAVLKGEKGIFPKSPQ